MDRFHKISKDVVHQNLINLRQLVFEVTDNCNLHCKYCAYAVPLDMGNHGKTFYITTPFDLFRTVTFFQ